MSNIKALMPNENDIDGTLKQAKEAGGDSVFVIVWKKGEVRTFCSGIVDVTRMVGALELAKWDILSESED
jgi:hypothetical protein